MFWGIKLFPFTEKYFFANFFMFFQCLFSKSSTTRFSWNKRLITILRCLKRYIIFTYFLLFKCWWFFRYIKWRFGLFYWHLIFFFLILIIFNWFFINFWFWRWNCFFNLIRFFHILIWKCIFLCWSCDFCIFGWRPIIWLKLIIFICLSIAIIIISIRYLIIIFLFLEFFIVSRRILSNFRLAYIPRLCRISFWIWWLFWIICFFTIRF